MAASGNELVTLNQLKETKDRLSDSIAKSVAAETTERQNQDGALESSIATKLGTHSVIAGNNVTVTPDDTAHTVTISADADAYTLPIASASTLGGIKVGNNLAITDDGVLSASGQVADFVSTETSTRIGRNASATKDNTNVTIVGHDTSATGKNSTTLGATTTAAEDSIAIGSGATAPNSQSTVIGRSATSGGQQGTVLGWHATSSGWATAIGSGAKASGMVSTATGLNAQASGDHATSIGASATASGAYSVAIGAQSQAPDDNTISVGSGTLKRRVVNVADPTGAQDAATKAYVDAHTSSSYTLPAATASTLGGVKIGAGINVTPDGTISVSGGSGGSYTLPAATASTLGGVKVGTGLGITSDGTLSTRTLGSFDSDPEARVAIATSGTSGLLCLAADSDSFISKNKNNTKQYLALKPATTKTLGGVKTGDTAYTLISNADGAISLNGVSYALSNYAMATSDLMFWDLALKEKADPNYESGTGNVAGTLEFDKNNINMHINAELIVKATKDVTVNGDFCSFDYSDPNASNDDYYVSNAGFIISGTVAFYEFDSDAVAMSITWTADAGNWRRNLDIQEKKMAGLGYASFVVNPNTGKNVTMKLYSSTEFKADKIYLIAFEGFTWSMTVEAMNEDTEGEQS